MENNPEKPKIVSPEIEASLKEIDQHLEENEQWLGDSLRDLKEEIEYIEFNKEYLEHMRDSNEGYALLEKIAKEEGFEKPKSKKYSSEDISKIEQAIETAKGEVKKIHEFMTTITLNGIEIKKYKEEFEHLQQRFNSLLIEINPDQEN
jgi:FtsZ-binding cell division protein ZapB